MKKIYQNRVLSTIVFYAILHVIYHFWGFEKTVLFMGASIMADLAYKEYKDK